jgi:hypothetical protein
MVLKAGLEPVSPLSFPVSSSGQYKIKGGQKEYKTKQDQIVAHNADPRRQTNPDQDDIRPRPEKDHKNTAKSHNGPITGPESKLGFPADFPSDLLELIKAWSDLPAEAKAEVQVILARTKKKSRP